MILGNVPPKAFSGSSSKSDPVVAVRSVLNPASDVPHRTAAMMPTQISVLNLCWSIRQIMPVAARTQSAEPNMMAFLPTLFINLPTTTDMMASVPPKQAIT